MLEQLVMLKNGQLAEPTYLLTLYSGWLQLREQMIADETKETLTAVHESGHAVMCWLVEMPFEYVTVIPSDDYYGCIKHGPFPPHLADDVEGGPCRATEMFMDRRMIVLLAGYAAEALYLDPRKPDSDQSSSDISSTVDMTIGRFGSAEQEGEYVDRMLEDAKDSLLRFWPQVVVLSIELLEKKAVEYSDVVSIMESLPND